VRMVRVLLRTLLPTAAAIRSRAFMRGSPW
jgi:hypothetical protein